ncbi:MAG: ABC transporter permease [Rhodospirillaceae bacterium]|nr:ABC transporter permease [Rhodospirillaceae bacterium]
MIGNILLLSFREIRRNVLRSILTTLGIVIGVAAVIIVVTLGEGTKAQVQEEISKLGSTMLTVFPGQRRRGGGARVPAPPFEMDDVNALRRETSMLSGVAPMSIGRQIVVYGNANRRSQVVGTDREFVNVRSWGLAAGRLFTPVEEQGGKSVCIIGETVRKELFKEEPFLGKTLRVSKASCEVIGLLEPKGQVMFSGDQDDVVAVPVKYYQRRISGNKKVDQIYVSALSDSLVSAAQSEVEMIMRERRPAQPGSDDLFTVRGVQEMSSAFQSSTTVMTGFLSAIAAISLLVGGIGIMNIMLVSVTERTREIGIRMAIGAREKEVLFQFLVEAAMLSGFGGIVGILVGLSGAWAMAPLLNVPFIIQPDMMMMAFVFSALVGLVFGYMPAQRAARLDPIEALRHE